MKYTQHTRLICTQRIFLYVPSWSRTRV